MIPNEKLLAVKTIVVHGNCPDGLASAIILKDVLPGREMLELLHGISTIEPKEGMLFCDCVPDPKRAGEFRDVGTIVLDHHKGVRDVTQSFKHHAFADEVAEPAVSGALLAYEHVWKPLDALRREAWAKLPAEARERLEWVAAEAHVMFRLARLAGIRDTWQRQDPEWEQACEQAEMLLFYPRPHWLEGDSVFWPPNLGHLADRKKIGRILLERSAENSRKIIERASFFISTIGTKVAILPVRYVSDAADRTDADLVIGFSYNAVRGKPQMILSSRSRGDYDALAFMRSLGGGGHTKAAGCTLEIDNFSPNPYAMIRRLHDAYENANLKPL